MPAPKTIFIPYSCFGYYDESFEECSSKCKYCKECRNATESQDCEEVRRIYKYKTSQIEELVAQWKKRKK